MPAAANAIAEVTGVDTRSLPDSVLLSTRPLVLRGVGADWPVVRAGLQSPRAAADYLLKFYRQATVHAMLAGPDVGGRYFYNDDFTGFNFKSVKIKLDTVLDQILQHAADPRPPSLYVGSATLDTALPDFRRENDFGFGPRDPLASIWIGNRTRIAAHQDLPDNLACVAVGRRRFTLFPPEQLDNLYVGPLDITPAGQAISLVDFSQPDFAKHPRFAEALRHSHGAELGPGDAIFIPSMWWHHIESLEPLNVLVNYWWRQSPGYMDSPFNALLLAILTVRDLPPEQLAAWKHMFDHYVFDATDEKSAHVPPSLRSVFLRFNADQARNVRAHLLQMLNR